MEESKSIICDVSLIPAKPDTPRGFDHNDQAIVISSTVDEFPFTS
jgi:hypothetical protein